MGFNYLSKKKQNDWTDDELWKLMELAGTMPVEDLVKEFPGRNIGGIKGACDRHSISYAFLRKRLS